jgi:ribosomal protein S21
MRPTRSRSLKPYRPSAAALTVEVYGSVDQALKVLKRRVRVEGTLVALKQRAFYMKPGEKRRAKHRRFLGRREQGRRRLEDWKARNGWGELL